MAEKKDLNDMFLAWRSRIARAVSRIVPPHEIEDIVQETYVRACQIKPDETIRSPGAFMTRIARNLAIDYLKRAETRLTSPIEDETIPDTLPHLIDETFDQVASREEFALFCEAVRDLNVQCRRVFVLKKVYGHTQREIAETLNLSENTVEKHIAQGIKRCTLYMRNHGYSEKKSGSDPQTNTSWTGGSK